jgi:hypothetical protein
LKNVYDRVMSWMFLQMHHSINRRYALARTHKCHLRLGVPTAHD